MGDIRLTDDEFYNILRENNGLYSRTAKAIESRYQIDYTRQAVYDRASKQPEVLQEIREGRVDKAEQVHDDLLDDPDPRIRKDAAQFI